MSYNGSGTFQINSTGQPVVSGTVISSTAFNALTADLATGLSTAITKDGQTATTARIPFAQGINSTLVTDSTSTTTGSIITAGGAGVAKALFVGTTANVAGAVTLQSTLGVTGITTFSAQPIFSSLTASSAVATDASKGLVSVTNTGTGNNVLATSPTLVTPVLGAASATSVTVAAGAVGTPSITTAGDTNTGIFFPAADTIAFAEGGAEAMRIDASGNLGLGATPAASLFNGANFNIGSSSYLQGTGNTYGLIIANNILLNGSTSWRYINSAAGTQYSQQAGDHYWYNATSGTAGNEASLTLAMKLENSGSLLVGKTASSFGTAGVEINAGGGKFCRFTRDGGSLADFNRLTDDGELVGFWQATTQEGSISVSGTTVSYNGGHLSRWAQTTTAKDDTLVKGTVLSNLDEMNVYVAPTTYWTEEDELPEGVSVGDVKAETHSVDNEQLNKVKVSDVEGDANVAGVFVNWSHDDAHDVDEINMAMTGDMIIRIAQGTTVARGDLLMSAGNGTAKPQGDDIVRSKTVAKVTSTHVTCTYSDGSYCVPCVLMAC